MTAVRINVAGHQCRTASNKTLTLRHVFYRARIASIDCRRGYRKDSINLSRSRLIAVSRHLTFEELLDYAEERLAPGEAQRVSEHLAVGCSCCAEDLTWLRRTLGLMATDALVSAPPALVQRVQGLYRAPRRRPATWLAALRPRLQGLYPAPHPRPTAWLAALWSRFSSSPRLRYAATIAFASLLILGGTWWAWGNATVAQAATLAEVHGPVEVRLPGATSWQPAVAGMTLTAGSALRSGDGATAVLLYPDGSRTQLIEDAQLEILSLTGRRNHRSTNVRLNLRAGRTQHELIRKNSSLQVEAPGAVAQAGRGDYEVRVEDEAVEVRAGHGNVTLSVEGTTTYLSAGERGWVKGGHVRVATPQPGDNDAGPDTPADTSRARPGKGKSGQHKIRTPSQAPAKPEHALADRKDKTQK